MTITELIEELEEMKEKYGDIDVRRYDSDDSYSYIDFLHYEKNEHSIYGLEEWILLS